ncbi:MAG: hypothetical protein AB8B87_01960 [Granulosicoccus sp.]
MQIVHSKILIKKALMCWLLFFSAVAGAETVSYKAISDFPVTNAGEVPYYVDQARQALAINAAVVEQRNRFARAEVVFDGQPGIYRITLIALAELDGEADYRLSINGEIVGLASNPEVVEDFSVVRHQFEEISVPAGAVIGVESLANSNGKIPENGEFAFARGRWTALELSTGEESGTDPDLSLMAVVVDQNVDVGDEFDISLSVSNAANSDVATGIVVSLSLPADSLELVDQSVCSSISGGIECALAELPAEGIVELTVSLRALAAFSNAPIIVSVVADQSELSEADNAVELRLEVSDTSDNDVTGIASPEPEPEIDENSGDSGSGEAGEQSQTESTPGATTSSSNGGGAISLFMSFWFVAYVVSRRRKSAS